MSSFNNSTPNFDNLLLQSLLGRLQIRSSPPSNHINHPLLSQSLEDLLLDATNLPLSDSDSETSENGVSSKTQLAKEESKLEKELIKVILSGKTETLKPNSGQAVAIGEHHICVGFHEEPGSDYRVWEWHGHIMLFDEENGYVPEYIYGNYFERLVGKVGGLGPMKGGHVEDEVKEKKDEKVENLGLRELIENGDSGRTRVLHRGKGVSSPSDSLLSFLAMERVGFGNNKERRIPWRCAVFAIIWVIWIRKDKIFKERRLDVCTLWDKVLVEAISCYL